MTSRPAGVEGSPRLTMVALPWFANLVNDACSCLRPMQCIGRRRVTLYESLMR